MADPDDTTDHVQDGYGLVPADRFQSMWFDHNLLPEGQREKPWIIFSDRNTTLFRPPPVQEIARWHRNR